MVRYIFPPTTGLRSETGLVGTAGPKFSFEGIPIQSTGSTGILAGQVLSPTGTRHTVSTVLMAHDVPSVRTTTRSPPILLDVVIGRFGLAATAKIVDLETYHPITLSRKSCQNFRYHE